MPVSPTIAASVATVLGFHVLLIAIAVIARRTSIPLAVLHVVGGLAVGTAWSLIPGLPIVELNPDFVFLVFLPPLLTFGAYQLPAKFFRANILPISMLAVGLVLVTMAAVALAAHFVVPELPLAAAFVLGAIVAPPDPVAAKELGGGLGLSNRLRTILEGEGLVNDATALCAYQLAISAVVASTFSAGHAATTFVRLAAIGIAVGSALTALTRRVLKNIDDPNVETTATLLLPFACYLLADRLGGSGVLATVAAGFVLRRRIHSVSGAASRLRARGVWSTVTFVVNGVAFMLIGVELGLIFARGVPPAFWRTAVAVCAVVIAVRMAWMLSIPPAMRLASRRLRAEAPTPPRRQLFVFGWVGMRGVISLAAALAIPRHIGSGEPFPHRDLLVLVTFAVIIATLVGQGLTLPLLVRWLSPRRPAETTEAERAREQLMRATLEHLESIAARSHEDREAARRVRDEYERTARRGDDDQLETRVRHVVEETLNFERDLVEQMRDEGKISDDTAGELEHEIDLREIEPRRPGH